MTTPDEDDLGSAPRAVSREGRHVRVRVEGARAEGGRVEAMWAEAVKTEAAWAEAARVETARAEAVRGRRAQTASREVPTLTAEQARVEGGRAEGVDARAERADTPAAADPAADVVDLASYSSVHTPCRW